MKATRHVTPETHMHRKTKVSQGVHLGLQSKCVSGLNYKTEYQSLLLGAIF